MARLLFLSLPLRGHLDWGGMLDTAAALAARGHAVAWASGAAVEPVIAAAGVDFIEVAATGWQTLPRLPEGLAPAARVALRQQRSLDAWLSPAAVLPALADLERLLAGWRPHALLVEPYAVAGALAAERAGLPLIVCGRPAQPDGAAPANLAGPRAAELCRLAGVAGRCWELTTGQVRSSLLHIDYFSRRWYADLPAIAAQTCFAGANPMPASPEPLDPPAVLVTLGSLFNQDPAFFRIAAEAVLLEGGQPLVVTGAAGAAPPGLPAGVEVRSWVNFDQTLPRLAGIIHHGGVGVTHAALRAGLPQVAVPHAGDQQPQAGRITAAGVGYGVTPTNFTRPAAAWLARQLLENAALRQAAAAWQVELAALGGVEAAALSIESNLLVC